MQSNLEQFEAEQSITDFKRDNFIDSLPPSERKQFAAATKAANILIKAKVPFHLFVQLPDQELYPKTNVWQWNSNMALLELDAKGKPIPESQDNNRLFTEMLFYCLYGIFNDNFKGDSFFEKLNSIPVFFHHCISKTMAYWDKKPKEE